jgi:hypothetical protein
LPYGVRKGFEGINMISKENLEHGVYYRGVCRNATLARWNADKQVFVHWRCKWGKRFLETIGYWVDEKLGERRFDEFKPLEKVESPREEIPLNQVDYLENRLEVVKMP